MSLLDSGSDASGGAQESAQARGVHSPPPPLPGRAPPVERRPEAEAEAEAEENEEMARLMARYKTILSDAGKHSPLQHPSDAASIPSSFRGSRVPGAIGGGPQAPLQPFPQFLRVDDNVDPSFPPHDVTVVSSDKPPSPPPRDMARNLAQRGPASSSSPGGGLELTWLENELLARLLQGASGVAPVDPQRPRTRAEARESLASAIREDADRAALTRLVEEAIEDTISDILRRGEQASASPLPGMPAASVPRFPSLRSVDLSFEDAPLLRAPQSSAPSPHNTPKRRSPDALPAVPAGGRPSGNDTASPPSRVLVAQVVEAPEDSEPEQEEVSEPSAARQSPAPPPSAAVAVAAAASAQAAAQAIHAPSRIPVRSTLSWGSPRTMQASTSSEEGVMLRRPSSGGSSPSATPRASPDPGAVVREQAPVERRDQAVSTSGDGLGPQRADAGVSPMPSPPPKLRGPRLPADPVRLGSEWDLLSSENSLLGSMESLLGVARSLSPGVAEGAEGAEATEDSGSGASEGEYLLSSEGEFYAPASRSRDSQQRRRREKSGSRLEAGEEGEERDGGDLSEGQVVAADVGSSTENFGGVAMPDSPGEYPRRVARARARAGE